MRPSTHSYRVILTLAATLFIAAMPAAGQTTLTATLSGTNEVPGPGDPDGHGFAVIDLDPTRGTVRYTIITQGIVTPTAAHIHRGTSEVAGGIEIDLAPEFENSPGSESLRASGTVDAPVSLIEQILADPAAFYVNVHNAEYGAGAIRGQLTRSTTGATQAVFPIAGSAAGANGTFFRTSLALLNDSEEDTVVVLEYYESGIERNQSPTATATIDIDSHEQETILVSDAFDLTEDSTGAIRVLAPREIVAVARIFNDQRPIDGGTFGQFVPSFAPEEATTSGVLPMLQNVHPSTGLGSRTNIGWFNPHNEAVDVVFRAHRSNGTVLEAATRTIQPRSQLQVTLNDIFASLEPLDAMYVSFTVQQAPVFVYASVIDNVTGDAVFIPAQARESGETQ